MHVGWKGGIIYKIRVLELKILQKKALKRQVRQRSSLLCVHMEHLQRMPEKGCLVRLPLELNSLNKNNILGNYYSDGILKHFSFFLLELINKYKLLVIKND